MQLPRHRALALLTQCDGDEIWSEEHCRSVGVPEAWVDELVDNFESNFDVDRQTIYVGARHTNQYRGVRDVDLAKRLASTLGLDVERVAGMAITRRGVVNAIKEAVMDGD